MGSSYSNLQKTEFKIYQTLMDKAIKDSDSYANYRQIRDYLQKELSENRQLI